MKALDGIRVVDLSRVLAGPFCTQMFGDLGAEVIKVEQPGTGDDTRYWGPPFLQDKNGQDTTESAYYLSINRNKKSVEIDLSKEEGQAALHELIEDADILIQNFKVGGLERFGFGYEQLKDRYPSLIYCTITGFGRTGPLSAEPGYDFLAQAMAGLMACTGEPAGPPMKVGVALSDILTGLNASVGVLAALYHREKTGQGQLVDVALTDCTLAALTNVAQYYLTSGKPAPRVGNAHSTIVPYQAFEASDGFLVIAVGNNRQFQRLCRCLKKTEWVDDMRFSTNADRVKNRSTLTSMIADIIKTQTTQDWISLFSAADVPAGPVNTMGQIFEMEQIQARGMKIQMDHPLSPDPINLIGNPVKLSKTPVQYDEPPPILGQHNEEILTDLKNRKRI